jgi:hypothetical protein
VVAVDRSGSPTTRPGRGGVLGVPGWKQPIGLALRGNIPPSTPISTDHSSTARSTPDPTHHSRPSASDPTRTERNRRRLLGPPAPTHTERNRRQPFGPRPQPTPHPTARSLFGPRPQPAPHPTAGPLFGPRPQPTPRPTAADFSGPRPQLAPHPTAKCRQSSSNPHPAGPRCFTPSRNPGLSRHLSRLDKPGLRETIGAIGVGPTHGPTTTAHGPRPTAPPTPTHLKQT